MPERKAKHVRLVNLLCVLVALVFSLWIPPVIGLETKLPLGLNAACVLGAGLSFALNRSRLYFAATTVLTLVATFGFAAQCFIWGRIGSTPYTLAVAIVMPLLTVPTKHRWRAMPVTILAALTMVVVVLYAPTEAMATSPVSVRQAEVANAILLGGTLLLLGWYVSRTTGAAEDAADAEREESERLLRNILPDSVAAQLKITDEPPVESFESVTILFADIVGFTALAARLEPERLVAMLNEIFNAFDSVSQRAGLEKIKTIGDSYMLAGGLPQRSNDHAERVARVALQLHPLLTQVSARHEQELDLRIGIHSGPVVAGVIGHLKFSYDLWGDTVNVASRMESQGVLGRIQLSDTTRDLLGDDWECECRGTIDVKGKGLMTTYLLVQGPAEPTPPREAR